MTMRGTTDPARPAPAEARPRRRWGLIGLAAAVAVAAAALAAWFFVLRGDAPEAVNLDAALDGLSQPAGESSPSTTAGATAASTPAAAAAAAAAEGAGDSGVAGTWTVNRSITNAEGTGSFGGFRVNEQLVGVGAATAVGRSRTVEGTLTVEGTTVTAASISVDLTAITTNDSRRNDAVQRALSTSQFPKAMFTLTRPVSVGSAPGEGERIDVKATGDLTIKGVTRSVTVDLSAQLQGGVLVGVGSTPVTFADFGVRAPTAPIVASVEDHGVMEFQLYFTKR